ncbi:MAG TPA: MBL fold metallo-hydrolase, partial [Clostridiales bacterium]|nr:MBL fold metallo-hydrolase [Clostridiales bacterium]
MVKFCSLFSGSSGNCLFFGTEQTKILIDAGLSRKAIFNALEQIDQKPDQLKGILLTHEHNDHVRGAGILSRTLDIPIYATEGTWKGCMPVLGEIDEKNMVCIEADKPFEIDDLCIQPYRTPHDANDPVGYCLLAEDKKTVVATDIGKMTRALLKWFEKSDLLFLESNHDIEMLKIGSYPQKLKNRILGDKGHLCNEVAAKTVAYMVKTGVTRVVLGHLSEKNNFKELAYITAVNEMKKEGILPGRDATVEVADRY